MIVGNRYELHDMVAQGAYGMVFRATDTRENKQVAVKMLSGGAKQDPNVVERLVREQQALEALSGTHAVGAIDLCRAQTGALCLVMEWLEGVDMEQHLEGLEQSATRMEASELLAILRPVLDTLEKAHELGIVHRDIKPANIFLLSEGRGVRLLDFGLSRLKSSATLTAVGMVMGSPSYMAPEAWKGDSKAIGKQADLYSVAVIVFRALAGRVPFDSDALVEKMRLVTTGKRPSLRARRPDLPLVVDAWIERALAIDPGRRFQHASHFLESLEAALAGLPLPTHTLATPARGVTSIPPPKTTEEERENAVSAALSRAASLLKRFATSFSRLPTATSEKHEASPPPDEAPPPELPKPPRVARAPERPAPRVPRAPMPPTNKKTIELGDDDLVEWLLDDDMGEVNQVHVVRPEESPLASAAARMDADVKAALTPPPPAPDDVAENTSSYDDGWDEVTLPRAQRIVVSAELPSPLLPEPVAAERNGDPPGEQRAPAPDEAAERPKAKTASGRRSKAPAAKKASQPSPSHQATKKRVRKQANTKRPAASAKAATKTSGKSKQKGSAAKPAGKKRGAANTPTKKKAESRSTRSNKRATRKPRPGS